MLDCANWSSLVIFFKTIFCFVFSLVYHSGFYFPHLAVCLTRFHLNCYLHLFFFSINKKIARKYLARKIKRNFGKTQNLKTASLCYQKQTEFKTTSDFLPEIDKELNIVILREKNEKTKNWITFETGCTGSIYYQECCGCVSCILIQF